MEEHQPLLDSGIESAMGEESGKDASTNLPLAIYLLAAFSALGGFLFGYDTGVVSGAMILIREEFELNTIWHEVIVSATIAAAWLSALIAGPATDYFGRRPVILSASLVFAVGAVVMGAAQEKIMLLIGRIIVGIGIGFASMSVPVYLSESSPVELRGRMTVTNTLFITGGQTVASIICGAFSTVTEGWRYMLGLAGLPAVMQLVGFSFLPESPRWLVAQGRIREARDVLRKIRCESADLDTELDAIKEAVSGSSHEGGIKQILKSRPVRRALLLGCLLQLFQQISGINTVICGVCTSQSACGFCYVGDNSNITSSFCVAADHASYNEMSTSGLCANSSLLDSGAVTFAYDWCPFQYAWLSLMGLALYLLCFSPGMGPMPWTINSEIYPGWARSSCTSITTAVNWASNLLVSLTFLTLTEVLLKQGAFYLYMGLAGLGFIILFLLLPETRGIPLENMEKLFSGSVFHISRW